MEAESALRPVNKPRLPCRSVEEAARVRLGGTAANPARKVAAIVAGMLSGADSIDDLVRVRHGGLGLLFESLYAPSTLGSFLREFAHGHARRQHGLPSWLQGVCP